MTDGALHWERILLDHALQAMDGWQPVEKQSPPSPRMAAAYRHCAEITSRHSRTFYLASGLLPPAKRLAARALYAFCRISDEIVDRSDGDAKAALDAWRRQALSPEPASDPVLCAWEEVRTRYGIPRLYVEQLLAGLANDLVQKRYDTFAELAQYCYGVACTVGLMSMHIVGFSGVEAIPYAIKLGVALQLTNILRDVAEDWQSGRLYLPRADLDAFGVTEEDIARGRVTPRWQALLQFEITRIRRLYSQAWPGIAMLDRDGRFAIAAAGDLYEGILDDIQAHHYDVFSRRAHVSAAGKARRLLLVWLRVQRLARHTTRQTVREQPYPGALL
jgi:15-cis-phytoene synthase